MKKITIICLLLLCINTIHAQKTLVYNTIQKEKNKGNFTQKSDVLKLSNKELHSKEKSYFKDDMKGGFLKYNAVSILNEKNKNITLTIPVDGENLILELIDFTEKVSSYNLVTSSGSVNKPNTTNKHYRGIIKDNKESLVAISFFDDEIIGTISYKKGSYNIAKMKNSTQHLIYEDYNLKKSLDVFCDTPDNLPFEEYDENILSNNSLANSSGKCVALYFETEFDIFQNKGSVSNVVNYVTGLYNQVATIYQNENIDTTISEIKIWNTPDPYTGTNTGTLLSQFQSQISDFNGTLGQLLTFRKIGGGRAAGFNGICNSNRDASLSVSGSLQSTVTPFPTYSWNVFLITHEFGHLFGSRHTHACVWNGNNTAIDGCSGFTEGSCSIPGIPSQGGTIMSYCHQSVGINFSLGFGNQPGNVIRNNVASGSCISTCENCEDELTITQNVHSGNTDNQSAENSITASNTVQNGATANYDAGTTVFLKPGFYAKSGSTFRAFIAGCSQNENQKEGSLEGEIVSEKEKTNTEEENNTSINIYPNPTSGLFTISGKEIMSSYAILNQFNRVLLNQKVNNNSIEVDIQHLSKGVYFIRIQLDNGEMIIKKIMKE